jgi:1-acyl-sn-glycerol-3-phosphate acyltransferase
MLDSPFAKFIDLEKIIGKKNPRLLKMLPGFVLGYLKRTIHENDLNGFVAANKNKQGLDFVNAIIYEFGANITVNGTENIPPRGGCIFASNHPLGGLDALALMSVIGKVRSDMKFIVNDVLMAIDNLSSLWAPVNKHGRNTTETTKTIDELYASEQATLIFPAGLVSRKNSEWGPIRDLEWKKSFITKAKKFHRDVIPVYIEGKNSQFFYGLARWRKRLGIKANIEMFYLVDEMYSQKNKSINIIIGKPVTWMQFHEGVHDTEWAERMKNHVYKMGKAGKPLPFDAVQ